MCAIYFNHIHLNKHNINNTIYVMKIFLICIYFLFLSAPF